MNRIAILFLFGAVSLFAQPKFAAEFIEKQSLKTNRLVAIDNFGMFYHIVNDVEIELHGRYNDLNYSNIQFGNITTANAFNPLKINLFYRDFNAVVILDNRLAEITKVDFNTLNPFRVVTFISTGNDNTIWLYNQNTQQLELFDYLNLKSRVKSLPIQGKIVDLKSNYNHCWILTENTLYKYNYTGSLIEKINAEGFEKLQISDGNVFLQKENQLFINPNNSAEIEALELPELLINQFLVTNETLYIYNEGILYKYRLKTD